MEPANRIILGLCLTVKMIPPLPTHSPHVRWETPGTLAHLPKRPVCLAASVASPQKAAWNWRLHLTTGDLKTPMLLTAAPCGVQRQVICFSFFLCLSVMCSLVRSCFPLPAHVARKKCLQKGSNALKNKDVKSPYLQEIKIFQVTKSQFLCIPINES